MQIYGLLQHAENVTLRSLGFVKNQLGSVSAVVVLECAISQTHQHVDVTTCKMFATFIGV